MAGRSWWQRHRSGDTDLSHALIAEPCSKIWMIGPHQAYALRAARILDKSSQK